MIEVEIRAKVIDFVPIKESLKSLGFGLVKEVKQIDRIFGHPKFLDKENKIIEGGLVVRIRQVDDKTRLDFKEIARQGGGIEVEANLDNAEEGIKLLKKLDFNEAFVIDKQREAYKYNEFEVALDKVEKLGYFIEIEKMVNSQEEIAKARQDCLDLLAKISPKAQITNEKYGDMMQNIINKK